MLSPMPKVDAMTAQTQGLNHSLHRALTLQTVTLSAAGSDLTNENTSLPKNQTYQNLGILLPLPS